MFQFFRRNTKVIGWSIVIFFAATMFSGTLFLQYFGADSNEGQRLTGNEVALIGSAPVNQRIYSQNLQGLVLNYQRRTGGAIRPEVFEILNHQALQNSVKYSLLLEAANKSKVKASRAEVNAALDQIYSQYKIDGKKALKAMLAQNGYPYKQFMSDLKNDIKVQKIEQGLRDQVTVSDKDVENRYTRLTAKHIFFPFDETIKTRHMAEEKARAKAAEVRDQIQKGMSFDEAVSMYSQDEFSKTNKGYISASVVKYHGPIFEQAIFALDEGELSKPAQTAKGFHLIKVTKKDFLPRPQNFNHDEEKKKILVQKQVANVEQTLQTILGERELNVQDPVLRAFAAKIKGDYDEAILEYQKMLGKSPQSAVPHYLLATAYLDKELRATTPKTEKAQLVTKAKSELNKAIVKAEISQQPSLPYAHLLMGHISRKQNQRKSMLKHYDSAFKSGGTNREVYQELQKVFAELKLSEREKKVKKLLSNLEEQVNQAAVPPSTAS